MKSRQSGVLMALSLLPAMTFLASLPLLRAGQPAPQERRAIRAVEDRTEYLCQFLLLDEENLHCATEKVTASDRRGQSHTLWLVQCTNPHGEDRAAITWNAETGALVGLSLRFPPTVTRPSAKPQRMTSAEALRTVKQWLGTLEGAGFLPPFQCDEAPKPLKSTWQVSGHVNGRRCVVVLNAYGGNILYARFAIDSSASGQTATP